MSAVVWCKGHVPTRTVAHRIHDVVGESGLNALQLYVQTYKQADLTLTGTVRKANLMMNAAKTSGAPTRRTSTTTPTTPAAVGGSGSHARGEATEAASNAQQPGDKVCITCGIDVTPKWWPIDDSLERRLTNGHHGVIGCEAQKFVEQRKFQCHKCRKAAKPCVPGPSPPAGDPPHVHVQANGQAAGVSPLRSLPPDFRPMRPEIHALLHHPASHAPAPAQAPLPPLPTPAPSSAAAPPHTPAHVMGPRPAPVSHPYAAGPPPMAAPYNDWGPQPGPRHASPPRHLNGGPPPLLNGPSPPMANLSSLRPPAMSGSPPAAPLSGGHQHPHGSPLYGNGMPPSPRRQSGPPPPTAYIPPYHGGPSAHNASPGLSNGAPPPARPEAFSHGFHQQRSPYAVPHGSPLVSRNGQLPAHEPAGPMGSRGPESRPASGASASPSLRNLLS